MEVLKRVDKEIKVKFFEGVAVALGAAAITLSAGGNALGDPAVSVEGTGHGRPGIAMAEAEVPYPADWVNMAPGVRIGAANLANELESSPGATEVDAYSQGALVPREMLAERPDLAGEISSMEITGDGCGDTGILQNLPEAQLVAGMPCPAVNEEVWDSVPKTVYRDADDPIASWNPPENAVQLVKVVIDYRDRHDYTPDEPGTTTEVVQDGNTTEVITHHEHSGIYDALQGVGITLPPDQEAILNGMLGR